MEVLINGLTNGLTIAVLALAFLMVYLPTRVFYVALGGIYAIVPFIAWAVLSKHWSWYVAVSAALLSGVGISLACELLNHARLERRGASTATHLMSSLGIYIVIVQVTTLIWGNDTKVMRERLDTIITIGNNKVAHAQLIAAAVSLAALIGFYSWLRLSKLGLELRGLADNPKELGLRGHNINCLRLVAFALAGALASISALVTSYDIGFEAHGGLSVLLLAIVAVIVGGRESFLGPVVGGILLGVTRTEVVWFLSARWQEAVTYLLLALFLFARPKGLLGHKSRLEADA
jgi:branched-chain amino acid transport system permease protein